MGWKDASATKSLSESVAPIVVADDLMRERKGEPALPLKLASNLAERLGAEIRLVHAYSLPKLTAPAESIALIEEPYLDAVTEALEQETETVRRAHPKLRIVPAVEKGDAVEVLLEDVSRLKARLLVLGTHARKGLRRAVLGSVAEEVIRLSPVPVLTVNPITGIREDYQPRKILVPVDLTEDVSGVVEHAAEYARTFDAAVVVLSVIEEWVYPVVQSASLLAGGFVMPLERDLQELAVLRDSQLHEIVDGLAMRGIQADRRLIERAASVVGAILEEAEKGGFDLIVQGHRHASRIQYALLGSVSRHIVREAHCPVLSVPPVAPSK